MPLMKLPHKPHTTRQQEVVERSLPTLLAALEDPDSDERWRAARALASYPEAVPALASRLLRESSINVAEAIIDSLSNLYEDEATLALVDCLRSEEVALRNRAVEVLRLQPQRVEKLLGGLLSDPNVDLRIFAVNLLESLRHTQVEQWLIQIIEHDAHVNVCAAAIDLLAEVGTEQASAPLRRVVARFPHSSYVRFAAATALGRIGET